jgi:hypothetical protein
MLDLEEVHLGSERAAPEMSRHRIPGAIAEALDRLRKLARQVLDEERTLLHQRRE